MSDTDDDGDTSINVRFDERTGGAEVVIAIGIGPDPETITILYDAESLKDLSRRVGLALWQMSWHAATWASSSSGQATHLQRKDVAMQADRCSESKTACGKAGAWSWYPLKTTPDAYRHCKTCLKIWQASQPKASDL